MAVDAETVTGEVESYDEVASSSEESDNETEAHGNDYGEWRWDPEINDWYWVYYDSSDNESSSSSNERYNADYSADDEEESEPAWEQQEDDDDDEQSSAEEEGTYYVQEDTTERVYQRASKDQTLIVFDWDDTIMP